MEYQDEVERYKRLRAENDRLQGQNQELKQENIMLLKQIKSAGLIISIWTKKHWEKLEPAMQQYTEDMWKARNERLHGGPDGNGDGYLAHQLETEAKEMLLSKIQAVENKEVKDSGFYDAIEKAIQGQKI